MPFEIHTTGEGLVLELRGRVTVRDAGELCKRLSSALTDGAAVTVRAGELEDVDTSVLQLLVSLRKSAGAFDLEEVSNAFVNAMDRCALRPELFVRSRKEEA